MTLGRGPEINVETEEHWQGCFISHPGAGLSQVQELTVSQGSDFIRALALAQKWHLQALVIAPGDSSPNR